MTHLLLTTITADERCQPRVRLEPALVDEYAQAMTEGAVFPPLTVYQDGATHWLADGFHRYHAARQAGMETIECVVIPGTLRDAILHAVGANATHGMRRTNLDKRRAVETLLSDPEWVQWSDSEIARRCAVSHPFVGNIRESILKPLQDSPRLATRNGTTYAVNTANIGRRSATAVLDPDDDEDYPEVAGEVLNMDTGEILVAAALRNLPPQPKNSIQDRAERAAVAIIEEYGRELACMIADAIRRKTA